MNLFKTLIGYKYRDYMPLGIVPLLFLAVVFTTFSTESDARESRVVKKNYKALVVRKLKKNIESRPIRVKRNLPPLDN